MFVWRGSSHVVTLRPRETGHSIPALWIHWTKCCRHLPVDFLPCQENWFHFFWLQWIRFPIICRWHILKRCQCKSSKVKTKDLGSCFRGNLKKLDFWWWNASSLLICAEVHILQSGGSIQVPSWNAMDCELRYAYQSLLLSLPNSHRHWVLLLKSLSHCSTDSSS